MAPVIPASPGWSTAHSSSRRNIQGGNHGSTRRQKEKERRAEEQEEEKEPERRRRATRVRGGTNARTNERESRCVYERRTTFCRTDFSLGLSGHPSCIPRTPFSSSFLRQPPFLRRRRRSSPRVVSLPLNVLARLWPRLFYFSRFQSAQTGFKIPPAEKSECLFSLFRSYLWLTTFSSSFLSSFRVFFVSGCCGFWIVASPNFSSRFIIRSSPAFFFFSRAEREIDDLFPPSFHLKKTASSRECTLYKYFLCSFRSYSCITHHVSYSYSCLLELIFLWYIHFLSNDKYFFVYLFFLSFAFLSSNINLSLYTYILNTFRFTCYFFLSSPRGLF